MEANRELQAIRKKLSHMSMKWKPSQWMSTSLPLLNNVMGHSEKGLPYGRMIEVSGWESQGKSAITLTLAALAQRDGAHVIWGDIENSFEADWAIQRGLLKCPKCGGKKRVGSDECTTCDGSGLDTSRLTLIQPYVGNFNNEKEPRLSTAQELCSEIEACMKLKRPEEKCFVVIDSIAALLTEGESNAGIEGANMNTGMDLAKFMGRLLRRWVGTAQVYSCMIILINQLREGPVRFGDPTRSVGGNAPKFYSHVRVRVKRVSGSKIISKGKTVGIKGIIKALKNKTGGEEGAEVGFRLFYKGVIEFVPAKEVTAKEE